MAMPVESAREQKQRNDLIYAVVRSVASRRDVRDAVEHNHDNNRWWPTSITDWRMRMAVAGWSTRVSYAMIDTYAEVVRNASGAGFDRLALMSDSELLHVVGPLGLHHARVTYFRSLVRYFDEHPGVNIQTSAEPTNALIDTFQASVQFAGYKVAQCAVLYARGYHCGIIPVDSGMISKLAPLLNLKLPRGPRGHEALRQMLELAVRDRPDDYRRLISQHSYKVAIPEGALPTWWVHLVLIYFKRLYLNVASIRDVRVCKHRPVCDQVLDCYCTQDQIITEDSIGV